MKELFRKRGESESASAAGEKRAQGQRVVLVVDDSPTEVHVFVNALMKAGYHVETAPNGEEAVRFAKEHHPDIILMDVVMPVLNGFQATRQLQRDPATADIPVIMVTSKDQETDRTWGLRQGALDYLVKPVNAKDLVARVKEVLGD